VTGEGKKSASTSYNIPPSLKSCSIHTLDAFFFYSFFPDPDPLAVALVRPAGTMAETRGTMAGTVVVISAAGTIAGMTVAGTPGTTAGMVTVGTTTVATTVAETTHPHVATEVLLLVVAVVQDARPALVQATAAPPTASPVSDLPALTIGKETFFFFWLLGLFVIRVLFE